MAKSVNWKQARIDVGLSVLAASKESALSRSYLIKLEKGNFDNIRFMTRIRLMYTYELSPDVEEGIIPAYDLSYPVSRVELKHRLVKPLDNIVIDEQNIHIAGLHHKDNGNYNFNYDYLIAYSGSNDLSLSRLLSAN